MFYFLVVSTSAAGYLVRLVSEMTYIVSSGTLISTTTNTLSRPDGGWGHCPDFLYSRWLARKTYQLLMYRDKPSRAVIELMLWYKLTTP